MFETIKGIIVDTLQVDEGEVKKSTVLRDDLGADSLGIFQIIMGLEEEFDIEMPDDEIENISTVGDAVSFLKTLI